MSDFVSFETNVPQELVLAYDDGKLVETRFGDKMFYTLTDGRTLSVTPDVASRITLAGIRKHQPFVMCKKEVRQPGRKKPSIVWQIGPEAPPAEMNLTQRLKASIKMTAREPEPELGPEPPLPEEPPELRASASAVTPAPVVSAVQSTTNGHSNGSKNGLNGHGRVNPLLPIPPSKVPMNVAVVEAVQIVQDAMKQTGEQWSDQSRQDLVSTILITAQREGWLTLWERGR